MLNIVTQYSVYASRGDINPSTSQKYFWFNADYPNEVEANVAAVRILENAERGANEVEIRTTTNIQKGI